MHWNQQAGYLGLEIRSQPVTYNYNNTAIRFIIFQLVIEIRKSFLCRFL